MNDLFNSLPFRPADILLPKDCEYSKWSVVACDQYTSQPEYWQRVEEYVGRAPSALRLILPESCLEGPNVETDIMEINNTMSRYLREGRFVCHPDAVFYVERTLDSGKVRRGLVGMVDLEQYNYEPGSGTPIRATEGTVLSRIPPRVAVRKNAPIELPHVMLLMDDPDKTVIEPLAGQTDSMEKLYPGLGPDAGAAGADCQGAVRPGGAGGLPGPLRPGGGYAGAPVCGGGWEPLPGHRQGVL